MIFEQLFNVFLNFLSLFSNPIFLISAIIIVFVLIKKNKDYKKTSYYQITKLPYFSLRNNLGKYGEYLTYKYLKSFEEKGAKFLFNVYIPKSNGETTEIDVLMISPKGIFVFESKNYSGWIFGDEKQKNWYQTLPQGKNRTHKEHFFNPVMQNRAHINHLKEFIGQEIPLRSIIVFSDRCTLKSVKIYSSDISVINRYCVSKVVTDICKQIENDLLTEIDIDIIYGKLYPYTQVDETTKLQHVESINLTKTTTKQVNIMSSIANSQNKTEDIFVQNQDIIMAETGDIPIQKTPIETAVGQTVLKCPKCNSNLIFRTATKGPNRGNKFFGCSNYPKCKYIQNI